MKIFITGATGYLGNALAWQLASEGHTVHALVRDCRRATTLQHPNIKIFAGELDEPSAIALAMEGCEQAYHVAGQVKPWIKDPSAFYETNVQGTLHICEQAIKSGINKLVFTSTTGVLGPTTGDPLNEEAARSNGFTLDYDRSKKMAEDVLLAQMQNGLRPVIVSPAKIFGPGRTTHALAANAIIQSFLRRGFTFVPSPSSYKVCFAYLHDVVNGHIQAMEKGEAGQRYILGGHNISYFDFFDRIRKLASASARIIPVPKSITSLAGRIQEIKHRVLGGNIQFTAASGAYAYANYTFSSEKAIAELDYAITPLDESITNTIHYLKRTL